MDARDGLDDQALTYLGQDLGRSELAGNNADGPGPESLRRAEHQPRIAARIGAARRCSTSIPSFCISEK